MIKKQTSLTALLLLFVTFSYEHAWEATLKWEHEGDMYTLTAASPSAWGVHRSANTFTNRIGSVLKSSYPVKVLDLDVHLRVFRDKNTRVLYCLIWSCYIVRTKRGETPDWCFKYTHLAV